MTSQKMRCHEHKSMAGAAATVVCHSHSPKSENLWDLNLQMTAAQQLRPVIYTDVKACEIYVCRTYHHKLYWAQLLAGPNDV